MDEGSIYNIPRFMESGLHTKGGAIHNPRDLTSIDEEPIYNVENYGSGRKHEVNERNATVFVTSRSINQVM